MMIRRRLKLFLVLIVGVLVMIQIMYCIDTPDISFAASGIIYYVSTSGNDNNNGSLDTPWKTIQKACHSVIAGDTVCILAGTYKEKITVPTSGTSGAYITIQNYNNDTVIVDGSEGNGDGVINITNKSYVRIKGLEICNSTDGDPPAGIFVSGYGSGIQILGNKIHNIESSRDAHGIAVYATSGSQSINNLIIDGNEVYNCRLGSSEAVVVNGNVDGFRITNNRVHDNNNIGIDCIGFEGTAPSNDQARNGVVSGNTVYNLTSKGNPAYGNDTCADGLYVDGGTQITIERNRVYNCDIGIEVASEHQNKASDYILVRNNVVSGCELYGLCFGGAESSNGYAQNCTFVNNTFCNNAITVQIQKAQNNILANNIFFGGTLREGNAAANTFNHNIWYGDSKPSGLSATDKYIDPRFVSSLDFHLQAASPAIDAGDPAITTDTVGTVDYEGSTRMMVLAVDCGAYEYNSGIVVTPAPTVVPTPTPAPTPTRTPIETPGPTPTRTPIPTSGPTPTRTPTPTPSPTPSATPSAFPAPASIKAVALSYNSVKISWDAVKGAVKYQLYRAASGTESYSLIATTAYTDFTHTSVAAGTWYNYKVRAYRLSGVTKVYSPFSAVVSIRTALGAPSAVSATRISSGNIKLAWGAVPGSTKYEVWRSESILEPFTRLAITSSNYYYDTKLSASTVYYYKIRAYRSVSGKAVYGDYSAFFVLQTAY